MEIVNINEVELHKLTETHPVMGDNQFTALVEDIRSKGQLQPVLVYRGKIVDGRHRLRALKLLANDTIKIERLNNNLSLEEVAKLVESSELRRHQTTTQLAIKGYRVYKRGGLTQKEAAEKVGCSLANLKHVVALEGMGRMDVIENLEAGGKENVSRDYRYNKMTDSLLAIICYVKECRAKLEGMQIESEDEIKENSGEPFDDVSLRAVRLLTEGWSPEMKKVLIAQLYKSMEG